MLQIDPPRHKAHEDAPLFVGLVVLITSPRELL
jgi:hypothetical protein